MNLILFDDKTRVDLLPLTYTRPVSDIRMGILTIREKWEKVMETSTSSLTVDYLSGKYKMKIADDNLFVNGSISPNDELKIELGKLAKDEKLVDGDVVIAARLERNKVDEMLAKNISIDKLDVVKKQFEYNYTKVDHLWDIFQKNGEALEFDFEFLTKGRKSQPISSTNQLIGDRIFLEDGAKVECSILNSTSGPIYIGRDAEIMEGSIVRGPLAMCESSALKLGTKIYGPTTVGPHSKVGGEVNNSVIIGYSNKGHDGFMGNSVIGEWCNLGADTNTSNLKNNYGEVKSWSYRTGKLENTGQQFHGLIMGDHSKCSINSMFNTATVVGICANIFGSDFPPKFVPSFSWGGADRFQEFKIEKAFEVAERMMERRGMELSHHDREILSHVRKEEEKFKN